MRRVSCLVILLFVEVACRHSVAAAANDAVGSCEATTCEPEGVENDLSSSWEFMNAFSKLGTSWNHVIGECT